MNDTLLLGAVAYDPKVVTIWDGFRPWFQSRGLDLDYVLFTNYERQVEALLRGQIQVAWNSPLAWLQTERIAPRLGRRAEAIAMRDSDQNLSSLVVVRAEGPIQTVQDLRGKVVAVGAADSPQATLIPLLSLAEAGLEPGRDFEVRRFDVLLGKHGDHIGGEREAVKALLAGEVAAACLIDGNHLLFAKEGTMPAHSTRLLLQSERYDHCNFTALDGGPTLLLDRFRALLLSMSYENPELRPLLDLEGLKEWRPARVDHYGVLARAIDRFGTIEPLLRSFEAPSP